MGKKKTEIATVVCTVTPQFDVADEQLDAFADKVEARIAQAVADGITTGMRKALPAPRPTAMRDGR